MKLLNFIHYHWGKLKGFVLLLCLMHAECGLAWKESTHLAYTIGVPYSEIDYFRVSQTQNQLVYGGIDADFAVLELLGTNLLPCIVRLGGGYRKRLGQDLIGGLNGFISLKGNVYSGLEMAYQRWEGVLNFKNIQMLEIGISRHISNEWSGGIYIMPQFSQHPIILAVSYYINPNSSINVEIVPNHSGEFSLSWRFNPGIQHNRLHKHLWWFPNRGDLRNDLRNRWEGFL